MHLALAVVLAWPRESALRMLHPDQVVAEVPDDLPCASNNDTDGEAAATIRRPRQHAAERVEKKTSPGLRIATLRFGEYATPSTAKRIS